MSNEVTPPNSWRFNLEYFADLLGERVPMIGEEPGSYRAFHEGMMRSLAPMTPYECVIAENLLAIEWELFQQRRMRQIGLYRLIREAIRSAVMAIREAEVEEALAADKRKFVEAGNDAWNWDAPFGVDEDAVIEEADDIAAKASSTDPLERGSGIRRMNLLGLKPAEFMSDAYASLDNSVIRHDEKVIELERRRREVKRDYDALVRIRPIDAEVVEA